MVKMALKLILKDIISCERANSRCYSAYHSAAGLNGGVFVERKGIARQQVLSQACYIARFKSNSGHKGLSEHPPLQGTSTADALM